MGFGCVNLSKADILTLNKKNPVTSCTQVSTCQRCFGFRRKGPIRRRTILAEIFRVLGAHLASFIKVSVFSLHNGIKDFKAKASNLHFHSRKKNLIEKRRRPNRMLAKHNFLLRNKNKNKNLFFYFWACQTWFKMFANHKVQVVLKDLDFFY